MKISLKSILLCALLLTLTACSSQIEEADAQNDTHQNTAVSDPKKPVIIDNSEPESTNMEQPKSESPPAEDVEPSQELPKTSLEDEFSLFKERLASESPLETYDDFMHLITRLSEDRSTELFAMYDTYLSDWANIYTSQMYFEEGDLSGVVLQLSQAYDHSTDYLDLELFDNETQKGMIQHLLASGYKFIWLEGSPYPYIDYAQFKALDDHVSDQVFAYIHVMAEESDRISTEDAGLMISWENLSSRIIQTESALNIVSNPHLKEKLSSLYKFYMQTYLIGLANTPIINLEDNKVLPEVLESYETIMTLYSDSEIAHVLQKYTVELQNMNFIIPYSDQEKFGEMVKQQSLWIDEALSAFE